MPYAPERVVNLLPFIAAVEARLAYELPETDPATMGYLSEPVDVPKLDTDGHVQRYWVLHPFGNVPNLDQQDLAETAVNSIWGFQATVAASYPRDVYALATRIDDALFRWAPSVEGYACSRCEPPLGFDPGPARKDESVKPHRYWLPLQYRIHITR